MSDLTNVALPNTRATLTVRIIKSLRFRTEKSLVLHNVDLTTTTIAHLKEIAKQGFPFPLLIPQSPHCCPAIATQPGWKPYRTCQLDTLKLYTKAHGAKTSNLIINLDHDDWMLDDDSKTLAQVGCENETELSFFSRKDYDEFKLNPETSWDV
ncbi:cytoplasmic protein [Pholiota conissans]|uniref:Cytoplasmic protein n=1 Tax=Pholiota conissans TaxID=109636 RepID=A0A9P6CX74_9AGAR|nr:cytoplasmic protein [Pholiota conissans]